MVMDEYVYREPEKAMRLGRSLIILQWNSRNGKKLKLSRREIGRY